MLCSVQSSSSYSLSFWPLQALVYSVTDDPEQNPASCVLTLFAVLQNTSPFFYSSLERTHLGHIRSIRTRGESQERAKKIFFTTLSPLVSAKKYLRLLILLLIKQICLPMISILLPRYISSPISRFQAFGGITPLIIPLNLLHSSEFLNFLLRGSLHNG